MNIEESPENNKIDAHQCSKYKKWIKIDIDTLSHTPFHTNIIRCSKCRSFAFLNFVHQEDGDYYGPLNHNDCEGLYVYLCIKNKTHLITTDDDE